MHWKLARDPYLRPLVEARGEKAAWDAGFFLDEDPADATLCDFDWRCTPVPRAPVRGERPAVLLLAGALCPVHEGHVELLERAREAAQRAGYTVLAGYLSPDHDGYVGPKCGASALPASERLRLCAERAAQTNWLLVDPWAALHRRVAVNFTDVCARLEGYLRAQLGAPVEVLFACGADNARFALAFAERGACVVVGRPGNEPLFAQWRERARGLPRALFIEGDNPAASRALRPARYLEPPARKVLLRVEGAEALGALAGVDAEAYYRALEDLFARFGAVRSVRARRVEPAPGTLSLDAAQPGAHTLALSRVFALGGYQLLGHDARPGAPPLAAQLEALPAGEYTLCDDDAATGSTLAAARALLPPRVRVREVRLAVRAEEGEEVADGRDFLLGAREGGLVVALPGGALGRAPYALPYVDPAARCGLAPRDARAFSQGVWALNAALLAGTGLRVAQLPEAARRTFHGRAPEETLEALCRWHLARLDADGVPALLRGAGAP